MTSRPDFDTPEFATDTLARVETVGRQWTVAQRIRSFGDGVISRLPDRGRQRLGNILRRTDDGGATELSELEERRLRQLLGVACPGRAAGSAGLAAPTLSVGAGASASTASVAPTQRDCWTRELWNDVVREEDISDREGARFTASLLAYARRGPAVARSPSDIINNIETLADNDDIENLEDLIGSGTASGERGRAGFDPNSLENNIVSNVKGIDGEVNVATSILDNEAGELSELRINELQVENVETNVDGSSQSTEIDIDAVDSDDNEIAVEVKNLDYGNSAYDAPPLRNSAIEDLQNKLEVVSRTRDEYVIVSRTNNPRNNEIIREAISEADLGSDFNPEADLRFVDYGSSIPN